MSGQQRIIYSPLLPYEVSMGLSLTEYIDREISEYCEYHWDNYRCADNSPFNLVDFRNCYAFQVIKNAYNETEPKASLRAHRGNDNDDVRMQDSRNMAYAQHYRYLQYQDMLNWTGYGEPELLPDDVESMEGKLTGHKKTAMQYFELETIARHPLLKAITNKRVCDVKKISNEVFIEYMKDYDALTASLVKGFDGDDEDVIFSAIALFTLEWKYQVELFYACAVNAELAKTTDIPHSKIAALCADCKMPIYTDYPFIKNLYIQSRFVLHRLKLVPLMYNGSSWDEVEEKIYHYLVMNYEFDKNLVHHDYLYEHYARISTRKQWAEFIRENYNIREIFKPKEWNNKRIRYVRNLYKEFIKEMPTPKL